MKQTFLYKAYLLNKKLFVAIVLFLVGTTFTNFMGWQATPFFIWGMYSEKEQEANECPIFKITVNDSTVIDYTAGYTNANRFFLESPLEYYVLMKNNNKIDPTEIFLKKKLGKQFSLIKNISNKVLNGTKEYDLFLLWYKKYLEQTTGIAIRNFKIELLQAKYVEKKLQVYSTELIDRWKQ